MKTFRPLSINDKTSGALLGNMGSANFLQRSSGGHKIGLTRTESIRSVRAARPDVIKKYPKRVARVTNKPSIKGFHVVGQGNKSQITLNELRKALGGIGYTHFRFGGLPMRSLFA